MITIHNYEAFALDYIEGELSVAEMAEMEALLSQNPALRAEFATLTQNWSSLLLEADETVVYADANKLLKPLSPVLGAAAPTVAKMQVFRYARIAAVAVGMLLFGSALYQILPNITQNDPKNGFAQSKNDTNTVNKIANINVIQNENNADNKVINADNSIIKTPIAAAKNTDFDIKNTINDSEKVNESNKNTDKKAHNSSRFAYHKTEKTANSAPENADILKNKALENQTNNTITATISQHNAPNSAQHNIENNIENNAQNPLQNVTSAAPQRPILANIDFLPTANVADFYFETDDTPQRIFMLSQNKNYFAHTQALKKRRQPLEAFLPEGTAQSERDGSIWKAFLPESTKENSINFAAIAETFRPSR